AESQRREDARSEREQPAHTAAHDQQHRKHAWYRAKVARREIHDAMGAIDERNTDGKQRGQPTEERALGDDARRRRPEHVNDEIEGRRSAHEPERAPNTWHPARHPISRRVRYRAASEGTLACQASWLEERTWSGRPPDIAAARRS